MKVPDTITELMSMVSTYKLFDYEIKIWYEVFAKHKNMEFRQNMTSYSLWKNGLCKLRYDLNTKTQIIENPQNQIAQQEINLN